MAVPKFEIRHDGESRAVADIMIADSEPKHFVRRRTYAPGGFPDNFPGSAFDKKARLSQSVYFRCMRVFAIVFAAALAASVYFAVAAENAAEGVMLYLTAFALGVMFAVFLSLFIAEYSFVNSTDDLFVFYDGGGAFCSVEIKKDRARVLYNNVLYVIGRGKVKTVRNERKLYCAYLNMFPVSVLQPEKYFISSGSDRTLVVDSSGRYGENGSCSLLPCAYGTTNGREYVPPYLIRQLNFGKYVFTLDGEMKFAAVCSTARESAVVGCDILTVSELKERGAAALKTLKARVAADKTLETALSGIVSF